MDEHSQASQTSGDLDKWVGSKWRSRAQAFEMLTTHTIIESGHGHINSLRAHKIKKKP